MSSRYKAPPPPISEQNTQMKIKNGPYFTPSNSGNAFLLALLFLFIISMAFGLILKEDSYWSTVGNSFLTQASFVLVIFCMSKISNSHKKLVPFVKKKPNYIAYAVSILTVLLVLFSVIMFDKVYSTGLSKIGCKQSGGVNVTSNWWQWIITIISLALFPAICEELIFRGIIYNGFRRYGAFMSILLTSFLFVIMHGGLYSIYYQAMLSVILILAIKNTGDIKLCMILHFVSNLTVLILDSALKNVTFKLNATFIGVACLLLVIAIALIVVYGFVMKKIGTSKETVIKENPELVVEDGKMMATLAVIIGIGFYIYVVVTSFLPAAA